MYPRRITPVVAVRPAGIFSVSDMLIKGRCFQILPKTLTPLDLLLRALRPRHVLSRSRDFRVEHNELLWGINWCRHRRSGKEEYGE